MSKYNNKFKYVDRPPKVGDFIMLTRRHYSFDSLDCAYQICYCGQNIFRIAQNDHSGALRARGLDKDKIWSYPISYARVVEFDE